MNENLAAVIAARNEWIRINGKHPDVVGMPADLIAEIDPTNTKSTYWSESFAGMDIFESNELIFKSL